MYTGLLDPGRHLQISSDKTAKGVVEHDPAMFADKPRAVITTMTPTSFTRLLKVEYLLTRFRRRVQLASGDQTIVPVHTARAKRRHANIELLTGQTGPFTPSFIVVISD